MGQNRYREGMEIQYRNGVVKVKTKENGIIPKARLVATLSSKVIGGGHELEPGERVLHLDMSSHGEMGHDDWKNLVVVKWRTTKFKFLKKSRIVFTPHLSKQSREFSLR